MNKNFLKFKEYYAKNLNGIINNEEYKENIDEIKKFNKEYSVGKISKLPLEEYYYNSDKPNNFCTILKEMNIGPSLERGGMEQKFGIHYKNKKYWDYKSEIIKNPEEYYKELRKQLVEVLNQILNNNQDLNYKKYDHLTGMSNTILKLAYLLNTENNLIFGNLINLKEICKYFEIEIKEEDKSPNLSYRIVKYIRENIPEAKKVHSFYIGKLLWSFYEKNINKKEQNLFEGKNIIVYGVPGSGKSYYINKRLKNIPDDRKERVTFYPEYTYYDFVGQKVPSKDGGLEFELGNFSKILKKALENSNKDYYLIIEELNRGNAEAIFGDIFQLLDRKNGRSEYTIDNLNLMEELNFGEKEIYIPSNLTIYATINNADQNVFNFDTAFSRRWEYIQMPCTPDSLNKDETENKIFSNGYIKGTDIKWNQLRESINRAIINNRNNIYNAEEKRIGLYYIDKDCLSLKKNDEDKTSIAKFSSKIFRYLYVNVFRNNQELIFNNAQNKVLEEYIKQFEKSKNIHEILNIDLNSSENK